MTSFVQWFRSSAPYINAHQGRTFVLYLDGGMMAADQLTAHVGDIALLRSLGIHLVVVTGARPGVERQLQASNTHCSHHKGRLITDSDALPIVQSVAGRQRVQLESLLSMGLPNTPMHHSNVQVVSGNYVIGKPVGMIDGQDHGHTGEVRRIRHEHIRQHLDAGAIVHLTCLGCSITGEVFNIDAEDIAASAAIALAADKLIMLTSELVLEASGEIISELTPDKLKAHLSQASLVEGGAAERGAQAVLKAMRGGLSRCHVLDHRIDGVLLRELFSHQGCGSQVSLQRSDQVRVATLADIGGILTLIQPLERQNLLVRRSRQLLEKEIEHFMVAELDGLITGCAALYPVPDTSMGELACLAAHPSQQRQGEAAALLAAVEQAARARDLRQLFVLSTQAVHWFISQGFVAAKLSDLPEKQQNFYNFQRGSKVLIKQLQRG